MATTPFDSVASLVQQHFTDGLVVVVGSGLSTAEGMPGMPGLAAYLDAASGELLGAEAAIWKKIIALLEENLGLEAALLKHRPNERLESWISAKTCELYLPVERKIASEVIKGERTLRLTELLNRVLTPAGGIPILTTNYDRLVEIGCEMAGYHVDTTAIGLYAGTFDHARSCMGSCRGIVARGKIPLLDHFPRAVVLKPHGSFDWYRRGTEAIRSAVDLDLDRLIITPGLNKYRAGYNIPFDKHRELANNHINGSARLLIVGYGFNDDHLQTHLEKRIRGGTQTLIVTRTPTKKALSLSRESPACICLSKSQTVSGVRVDSNSLAIDFEGHELWDIGTLAKELL